MEVLRPARHPLDRPYDRASQRFEHSLCRGSRPSVWPEHHPRSLPLARRRQNMAAHPICGRQDRSHRHPVRSIQSQHYVRGDVAGSAQAVDHGIRRPGQRTVSFRRRRRRLDQTHGQGLARRHDRTHWDCHYSQPEPDIRADRGRKGWSLPLR